MNEKYHRITESTIRRLIKYNGSCCDSCHEDMDSEYSSGCYIDFGKNREAEVCCAISIAYDKWLKERKEKHDRNNTLYTNNYRTGNFSNKREIS